MKGYNGFNLGWFSIFLSLLACSWIIRVKKQRKFRIDLGWNHIDLNFILTYTILYFFKYRHLNILQLGESHCYPLWKLSSDSCHSHIFSLVCLSKMQGWAPLNCRTEGACKGLLHSVPSCLLRFICCFKRQAREVNKDNGKKAEGLLLLILPLPPTPPACIQLVHRVSFTDEGQAVPSMY